jgi:hypothetical protein
VQRYEVFSDYPNLLLSFLFLWFLSPNTPKEKNNTPRVFFNTPFLFSDKARLISDKARLFENNRSLLTSRLIQKRLQSLSVLQPSNIA